MFGIGGPYVFSTCVSLPYSVAFRSPLYLCISSRKSQSTWSTEALWLPTRAKPHRGSQTDLFHFHTFISLSSSSLPRHVALNKPGPLLTLFHDNEPINNPICIITAQLGLVKSSLAGSYTKYTQPFFGDGTLFICCFIQKNSVPNSRYFIFIKYSERTTESRWVKFILSILRLHLKTCVVSHLARLACANLIGDGPHSTTSCETRTAREATD